MRGELRGSLVRAASGQALQRESTAASSGVQPWPLAATRRSDILGRCKSTSMFRAKKLRFPRTDWNPMTQTILETRLADLPVRRGKVRDVYDLGDELLLVSTDRISAFDWVLPTGIPDKGEVLTRISKFWFDRLGE